MKAPKRSFALVLLKLASGVLAGMLFVGFFDFQALASLLILLVLSILYLIAMFRTNTATGRRPKVGIDL